MDLPVAILAGGLATRMHPITKNSPKSLIWVAGDYFINHQLRYLSLQGISRVVLCLGHLGNEIQTLVGDGSRHGLEVSYSWDSPLLQGTGGALKQALPLLGHAFFILYGDSYLPINFRKVEHSFLTCGKQALITVYKNNNQGDKSNVSFKKNLIIEYNKRQPKSEMTYIEYGLSLLSAPLLESLPAETFFDLADFFHHLSLRQELAGYEVFEPFYEIGSWQGLSKIAAFLESYGQ